MVELWFIFFIVLIHRKVKPSQDILPWLETLFDCYSECRHQRWNSLYWNFWIFCITFYTLLSWKSTQEILFLQCRKNNTNLPRRPCLHIFFCISKYQIWRQNVTMPEQRLVQPANFSVPTRFQSAISLIKTSRRTVKHDEWCTSSNLAKTSSD